MEFNIVQDGKISISSELWKVLNESMTKVEIKEMIHDAIEDNNIPMPMREIELSEVHDDYLQLLNQDNDSLFIEGEWFSRYDYQYPITWKGSQNFIKSSSIGNKASDYFQQESRWYCDSINAPSPYRTWYNRKFRDGALNALWSLKCTEVQMSTLRNCIAMRKYIASQFRPSTAKFIYDKFKAKKVLDMSSGWGDRLCGFTASNAIKYVGFDPNERVHGGYLKQIECYQDIIHNDIDAKIHLSGSEFINEVLDSDETFDLIFTSPPYFNIEKYNTDETQSFKKFRKIEDWLSGFLFESLKQAWEHLEVGGHLLINISDVYSNHTVNKICDPMNEYLSTLNGSCYQGAIGYEMRKRPNSGALKGKVGSFAEPIWVWKKVL